MLAAAAIQPLDQHTVDRLVRMALDEDAPWGDLTSQSFVPAHARLSARLVAREPGVLSGLPLFAAAFRLTDPSIQVTLVKSDGDRFAAGDTLALVEGPARTVLQAERIALNFTQRLCGIATLTSRFVAEVAGAQARIVDTRKTTPGLRILERYAVRCGGGHNHRFSLSDAVLIKDNHLAVLQLGAPSSASARVSETEAKVGDITTALRELRTRLPHTTHIEVEVDDPSQIEPVLAAGVDTILLDNFTPAELRAAVAQIAGRALTEASGTVRLDTVADIARTGVDIISVGALTHSIRALDLGLDAVIAEKPAADISTKQNPEPVQP